MQQWLHLATECGDYVRCIRRSNWTNTVSRILSLCTVDFERRVAHVAAPEGEVGVGRGAVEAAACVPVVGAGVARQSLFVAAQQAVDRSLIILAGEIPQSNI